MAFRFDAIRLPLTITETPEGYLEGRAVVTRTGIFKYSNPDGSIRRELRHPKDVFSALSLDTLKMLPIVIGHPMTDEGRPILLTADNVKEFQVGQTGENYEIDSDTIAVTLKITDVEAVNTVKAGRRELSLGYVVERDEFNGGTWEGDEYDVRQINIRNNHLAIVSEARAGAMARLNLDADDAWSIDLNSNNSKEGSTMPESKLRTFTIDGISYEAAPEVINCLEQSKKENGALNIIVDALVDVPLKDGSAKAQKEVFDAFEAVKGERDSIKEKLDAAEKRDITKEIKDGVKLRTAILDSAKTALDESKFKELVDADNLDLMREVVISQSSKDRQDGLREELKDKEEAYVAARYDAVVESLTVKDPNALANQRKVATDEGASKDTVTDAKKSEQGYHDRLENAWKGEKESK